MDLPVTFLWPAMLIALVLIPVFIFGYMRLLQRRRGLAARFGSEGLVQGSAARRLGARRHIPPIVFLLALAILIVALARPQTVVSLPRYEGTIMLAFDVSRSMSADDLKPSRLEAAKAAARAFVDRQPATVQIGVVTFSDAGFATQPPTNQQDQVLAAINRLALQRGTSLAFGIQAALKAISAGTDGPPSLSLNRAPTPSPTAVPKGSYTSAVIVLLTDGENNMSPDPLALAQTAADRGIRIYTVGVGTADGTTLHLDGFNVVSRLDEATLQQIAQLTGGTYYNATTETDLHAIYDNLDPQLSVKPQKLEVTALFAGAGVAALMIGGALSLLWLGRLP